MSGAVELVTQLLQSRSPVGGRISQVKQAPSKAFGIKPLAHPLPAIQRLRADQVTETVDRSRFQGLAPAVEDGLYLVPRVVE